MVLIVGGTSGIGCETAKYLCSQGYDIIVSGRRNVKLKNIGYHYLDVTDEDSVKNCFLNIKNLDAIVYSAGVTTPQTKIKDFNKDTYNNIMDVNVTGLLLCIKYAYNILKKNRGKVVVISSLAARNYSKFSGIEYTISKTALSGVVKHLAIDLAKDDILINSIFPSMTLTSMLTDNVNKEILDGLEKKIPLGKLLTPIEIAKVVEFLISKNNTYMTGCGLDINGGQFLNG